MGPADYGHLVTDQEPLKCSELQDNFQPQLHSVACPVSVQALFFPSNSPIPFSTEMHLNGVKKKSAQELISVC